MLQLQAIKRSSDSQQLCLNFSCVNNFSLIMFKISVINACLTHSKITLNVNVSVHTGLHIISCSSIY